MLHAEGAEPGRSPPPAARRPPPGPRVRWKAGARPQRAAGRVGGAAESPELQSGLRSPASPTDGKCGRGTVRLEEPWALTAPAQVSLAAPWARPQPGEGRGGLRPDGATGDGATGRGLRGRGAARGRARAAAERREGGRSARGLDRASPVPSPEPRGRRSPGGGAAHSHRGGRLGAPRTRRWGGGGQTQGPGPHRLRPLASVRPARATGRILDQPRVPGRRRGPALASRSWAAQLPRTRGPGAEDGPRASAAARGRRWTRARAPTRRATCGARARPAAPAPATRANKTSCRSQPPEGAGGSLTLILLNGLGSSGRGDREDQRTTSPRKLPTTSKLRKRSPIFSLIFLRRREAHSPAQPPPLLSSLLPPPR